MNTSNDNADWVVYLIRNCHNALYCGVTNNLERRFVQHQTGKGAKALKGKGPLTLEWHLPAESKSTALKMEYAIKQLTKTKKEKIISLQLSLQLVDGQLIICDY